MREKSYFFSLEDILNTCKSVGFATVSLWMKPWAQFTRCRNWNFSSHIIMAPLDQRRRLPMWVAGWCKQLRYGQVSLLLDTWWEEALIGESLPLRCTLLTWIPAQRWQQIFTRLWLRLPWILLMLTWPSLIPLRLVPPTDLLLPYPRCPQSLILPLPNPLFVA